VSDAALIPFPTSCTFSSSVAPRSSNLLPDALDHVRPLIP
jgi:hypothetical protein